METQNIKRDQRLGNYFALVSLVPVILSILACELLIFLVNKYAPDQYHISQVIGVGMLIPMGLMTELFSYLFTRKLIRKEQKIHDAINAVADGDYSVKLDVQDLAPFSEVASDLNKMTDQLASVETLRKDFTGNFSHEFKTPIVSINGFANLLLDTDISEEERHQYLQIIADESARLAELSKNTMLLSRLDTATEIPDRKKYSLDDQIRQDIILLMHDCEVKKIDVEADLEDAQYYGNANMLDHVWINLFNNAIKFTPENGKISVSLKKSGNTLVTKICDTGKGMTQDQCQHIFERYYQADPSHATKGLGLGLAIAHKIVELNKGTITVESELGKGSCFTVTLPAVEE